MQRGHNPEWTSWDLGWSPGWELPSQWAKLGWHSQPRSHLYNNQEAAALTHTNTQHGPPQHSKEHGSTPTHALLPPGNRNSTAPREEQMCKEDIAGYLFQTSVTSSPKESNKQCQWVLHITDSAAQMIKVKPQIQGGQHCILLLT